MFIEVVYLLLAVVVDLVLVVVPGVVVGGAAAISVVLCRVRAAERDSLLVFDTESPVDTAEDDTHTNIHTDNFHTHNNNVNTPLGHTNNIHSHRAVAPLQELH